jgi:hypothetical protein
MKTALDFLEDYIASAIDQTNAIEITTVLSDTASVMNETSRTDSDVYT